MRILLATILLLAATIARGASYYIDFVAGVDSAAGTSTGTAWKHCPGDPNATSNAAAKASTLNPGDFVYFKGGVTYLANGASDIVLSRSGSSGNPITYDGSGTSWGTGKAVIDGNYRIYASCLYVNSSVSWLNITGFEMVNCGGWSDSDPVVTGANNTTPITTNTGGYGITLQGSNANINISYIYGWRLGGWRNTPGWQFSVIQGGGVIMTNASYVTVSDCEFTKTFRGVAIYSSTATSNIVVERCNMHNYITWGIDVAPTSSGATITTIDLRDNIIHDYTEFTLGIWTGVVGDNPHTDGIFLRTSGIESTWSGVRLYRNWFYCDTPGASQGGTASIFVSQGPSAEIFNNVLDRDAQTRGISIGYASSITQKQIVRIYNNTIVSFGGNAGLDVTDETNPAKQEVYIVNNIFQMGTGMQANYTPLSFIAGMAPAQLDYNQYYDVDWNVSSKYIAYYAGYQKFADMVGFGFEAHGAYGNPLHVTTVASPISSDNFTLQAGSPAADSGYDLSAYFTTDKNNVTRSGTWDRGAFTYSAGSTGVAITNRRRSRASIGAGF